MVSDHSATFGDQRQCVRGDINILANTVKLPQMLAVASVSGHTHLLPPLLFSLKHMTCIPS